MSIMGSIRTNIRSLPKGKPFTAARFLNLGPRSAVDKALSRLVGEGEILRVTRGVFARPSYSRYIGTVGPGYFEVVKVIAKKNGETLQVHGAEAARRFKLSTQMPLIPVFHTNGPSRTLRIGNLPVKLIHTSSRRRLQFAGKSEGLALSALWYCGKENVTPETVSKIRAGLSPSAFENLKSADLPAWMAAALSAPQTEAVYD